MTQRPADELARLSCRRRVELLCDYLDRRLEPSEKRIIAAHRRGCRTCASLLDSLTRTIKTLHELKRTKAPPSARRALMAALRRGRRR